MEDRIIAKKRGLDLTVGGFLIHDNKLLLIHHQKLDAWLAPGGHIEANETPDEAVEREFFEETGIEVEAYPAAAVPLTEALLQNLALPFHANVHSVGDHNHACYYYLVKATVVNVRLKADEIKAHRWLSRAELDAATDVWENVKAIARLAFSKKEALEKGQKP